MLIHWIWLSTRGCMNDRNRKLLLEHFGDAEDIFFAEDAAYGAVAELSREAVASLRDKSLKEAETILQDCGSKDIHMITWQDAAYPGRLRNIADPPVVLYYKGKLPDFDGRPLIGVVGTRKASGYGMTAAKQLGMQIASCGGVIVSGVASGIDAMAMRGALTAGAPVIGVLGCGADVVYPKSNRALFADTQRQGCLLTEFPPGTPPYKWNFPRRNRIISGLSCGVLVVEAPEISGALITARQAAEQGRDVFVVPGNIGVESCVGSNALLRDGAIAVSCGWDVMSEYAARYPDKVRKVTGLDKQMAYPDEMEQLEEERPAALLKVAQKPKLPKTKGLKLPFGKQKEVDNGGGSPYSDADCPLPQLTKEEEMILGLIRQSVTLVDDMMAQADLPAGALLAALTMLEIKGVVTRLPGKRVELKKRK